MTIKAKYFLLKECIFGMKHHQEGSLFDMTKLNKFLHIIMFSWIVKVTTNLTNS